MGGSIPLLNRPMISFLRWMINCQTNEKTDKYPAGGTPVRLSEPMPPRAEVTVNADLCCIIGNQFYYFFKKCWYLNLILRVDFLGSHGDDAAVRKNMENMHRTRLSMQVNSRKVNPSPRAQSAAGDVSVCVFLSLFLLLLGVFVQ